MYKILSLFLLLSLAIISCKNKEEYTPDIGYNYYPINQGDYFIYDVVDTSYQGVGVKNVTKYQMKYEMREPITINDETRYQIYVYYKAPNEEWKTFPDSNWTVFRDGNRIVLVENNVRFVKLVFPFEVNKAWDGNISDPTNDPSNYYKLTQVKRPFQIPGGGYYPQTVTVQQQNDSSVIDKNYSIEVYAPDNGMVYKQITQYKYDQSKLNDSNPLNDKTIEFGRYYVQKLLEKGRYQ